MEVPERSAQVFANVAERAVQGALPRDYNIIVPGPREIAAYQPYCFLQPAPRPVSFNCIAKPLCRRVAEAGKFCIVVRKIAFSRLEYEAGSPRGLTAADKKKFRAIPQTAELD